MKGGMQALMKQANQMQAKMKKMQEELAQREYEATAGGGAVSVKMKGETEIVSLKIDKEVISADDVEMLEDLILTAVNEVIKTAKETSSKEMEKVTGGFNMPGLF
jgi:DNA-binding YbaB/EbfC family protein